jgi:pyruvate/2-oxoglutarate dehydrogenase complex dihydrolipoamide acyltransferase (E2) component
MRKAIKHLITAATIALSVFAFSTAAMAEADADFEVTGVGYEDGVLKAVGKFTNTGDKVIEKVNKVDVGIYLYNEDGDSKKVADHEFTDLDLHLAPGEEQEYILEFPDVAEYTDATKWSAEEGDWEFTYFENGADAAASENAPAAEEATNAPAEAEATTEAPAADNAADEAKLDFNVTSVGYEDGVLKAVGTFSNIGTKNIEKADKVNVKITLYNDAGDSEQVGNHDFTNLNLHLAPGESVEYTLEFSDVAEYTDATKWSAEVGDWEFTYFE